MIRVFILASLFCVVVSATSSASIVISNAGFEDTSSSGLNNSSSFISSSSQVTEDIWYIGNPFSTFRYIVTPPGSGGGPGGTTTNALIGLEGSTSGGGTVLGRSAYQFIDIAGEGGIYELQFDYRRFRNGGGFFSNNGDISVAVYGIDDDVTLGWTTTNQSQFNTGVAPAFSGDRVPQLVGATTTELGFFRRTTLTNQWFTESVTFDLGDGMQYDQLVVRLGTRLSLNGRGQNNFDNLVLTAIPEPGTMASFSIACAILIRRRR